MAPSASVGNGLPSLVTHQRYLLRAWFVRCNARSLNRGTHSLTGADSMTRSDAIVRRQLLKAGLIIAGAPFCPEALFDGRAAAADGNPAEGAPIGQQEIIKGLDGMSRVADQGNVFGLGHNAAAVISSAFFCRDQKLDADTQ